MGRSVLLLTKIMSLLTLRRDHKCCLQSYTMLHSDSMGQIIGLLWSQEHHLDWIVYDHGYECHLGTLNVVADGYRCQSLVRWRKRKW